jgi:hypothetical protein
MAHPFQQRKLLVTVRSTNRNRHEARSVGPSVELLVPSQSTSTHRFAKQKLDGISQSPWRCSQVTSRWSLGPSGKGPEGRTQCVDMRPTATLRGHSPRNSGEYSARLSSPARAINKRRLTVIHRAAQSSSYPISLSPWQACSIHHLEFSTTACVAPLGQPACS